MEKKLSLSTITICIASLENLKKKMEQFIANRKESSSQVPSWVLDIRRDYEVAINELKQSVEL